MSGGPDFHAWTHRPKELGGTDPIDFPDASGGKWATGLGFQDMVDAGSFYVCWFDLMYTNDTTMFEPAGVSAGRAEWIQVNDPGFYEYQCYVIDIGTSEMQTAGQDLYIDPSFSLGGSPASIQNNLDDRDFLGNRFSRSAYQLSTDVKTPGLYGTTSFLWDPAVGESDMDFEDPLKLGITVAWAGGPSNPTVAVGAYVKKIAPVGGYTQVFP